MALFPTQYSTFAAPTLPRAAHPHGPADYPKGRAHPSNAATLVAAKPGTMNTAAFNYGYYSYNFLPNNFHFDADDNPTSLGRCVPHQFTKRVSQAAVRPLALRLWAICYPEFAHEHCADWFSSFFSPAPGAGPSFSRGASGGIGLTF